ncbi:hypothetical protein ACLRE7_02655 [Mycoplasmopsis meleagridis]
MNRTGNKNTTSIDFTATSTIDKFVQTIDSLIAKIKGTTSSTKQK